MRYEISSDKSVLVEFDSLQVNENEKQCTHRTETDVLYISSLNFKVLKTSTSSIFFHISIGHIGHKPFFENVAIINHI